MRSQSWIASSSLVATTDIELVRGKNMKIIKRNEKEAPRKWAGRFSCCECASVLEVEENDLSHFAGTSPRGNQAWSYAAFECPCCHNWNTVDLPRNVLERLPVKGVAPSSPPSGDARKIRMRWA